MYIDNARDGGASISPAILTGLARLYVNRHPRSKQKYAIFHYSTEMHWRIMTLCLAHVNHGNIQRLLFPRTLKKALAAGRFAFGNMAAPDIARDIVAVTTAFALSIRWGGGIIGAATPINICAIDAINASVYFRMSASRQRGGACRFACSADMPGASTFFEIRLAVMAINRPI